MTLTVVLEPAQPADHGAVVALLHLAGLPWSDLTSASMHDFVLARDGDQVVGSVAVERCSTSGLLRSLAVDSAWRRLGIGKALLLAVEDIASRKGIQDLWLLTTGASDYFEHHGYRLAERKSAPATVQISTQFQSICPASAACLRKPLS